MIGAKVPGSALLLPGNFTPGQQVAVDGDPWLSSDLNPAGLWVQVPWEWRRVAPQQTLTVRTPGNPFENVASISFDDVYGPYFLAQYSRDTPNGISVIAAHEDFHDVVSKADPALSGETIHVYMTGLGALERVLPTGIPGSPDAIRTLRPVACKGQTIGSSD